MKVIEIEQNFHFFIPPQNNNNVLFAGQRQNCHCGDHCFLGKHQKAKEVAFKGD